MKIVANTLSLVSDDGKVVYHYPEIGPRLKNAVKRLYDVNSGVVAIALVREVIDCGLLEAKQVCDYIADHHSLY